MGLLIQSPRPLKHTLQIQIAPNVDFRAPCRYYFIYLDPPAKILHDPKYPIPLELWGYSKFHISYIKVTLNPKPFGAGKLGS